MENIITFLIPLVRSLFERKGGRKSQGIIHEGLFGKLLGGNILRAFANLFTRKFGLAAVIIHLSVVMLLVPGVATLRAMYVAQTVGATAGLSLGYEVFIIIAAVLGGLILGNAIVPASVERVE